MITFYWHFMDIIKTLVSFAYEKRTYTSINIFIAIERNNKLILVKNVIK